MFRDKLSDDETVMACCEVLSRYVNARAQVAAGGSKLSIENGVPIEQSVMIVGTSAQSSGSGSGSGGARGVRDSSSSGSKMEDLNYRSIEGRAYDSEALKLAVDALQRFNASAEKAKESGTGLGTGTAASHLASSQAGGGSTLSIASKAAFAARRPSWSKGSVRLICSILTLIETIRGSCKTPFEDEKSGLMEAASAALSVTLDQYSKGSDICKRVQKLVYSLRAGSRPAAEANGSPIRTTSADDDDDCRINTAAFHEPHSQSESLARRPTVRYDYLPD